ncbi:NADP-dependent oxidoreductase [Endozoicomonas sp. SCSIO W0465]|uniref:NADP-dependent oxidoreductase n=1 Tax=Endozoicomonas sp. SCSIO W0465 TaxID=2918516 RepID=UPI00273A5EA1|nr:zinc-binding dehydrogenase [Endozoicomonas sp. SCSIO W0465]
MEESTIPEPGEGQMLLKSIFLSLDPYQRGRMSSSASYAAPTELGAVMGGGTISKVVKSNHSGYQEGDWVLCYSGWQEYAISDGTLWGSPIKNLGQHPVNPSWFLGILGMPGFTAYAGLLFIGNPKEGETVVVAAAAGPVGATVGQIAKLKGCRVVGVASGNRKCQYATEVLGFDACIDRTDPNFPSQLKQAVPDGIDVYFESVGGEVFDAVWPNLNDFARIPLCGTVSQNNLIGMPDGPDRLAQFMRSILVKKLRVEGFIIDDSFGHRYNEFINDMYRWVDNKEIRLYFDYELL